MNKIPINLTINLYADDLEAVFAKAGKAGLTLEELIENFIGDLTYSDRTRNGSDECEKANEWFERCWFGMFPENTFLHYVLGQWNIDAVAGTIRDIEYNKEFSEDCEEDEAAYYREELEFLTKELESYYTDYLQTVGKDEKPQPKDEAYKSITDYWNRLQELKGDE
jgi:hypothetical protein